MWLSLLFHVSISLVFHFRKVFISPSISRPGTYPDHCPGFPSRSPPTMMGIIVGEVKFAKVFLVVIFQHKTIWLQNAEIVDSFRILAHDVT